VREDRRSRAVGAGTGLRDNARHQTLHPRKNIDTARGDFILVRERAVGAIANPDDARRACPGICPLRKKAGPLGCSSRETASTAKQKALGREPSHPRASVDSKHEHLPPENSFGSSAWKFPRSARRSNSESGSMPAPARAECGRELVLRSPDKLQRSAPRRMPCPANSSPCPCARSPIASARVPALSLRQSSQSCPFCCITCKRVVRLSYRASE
jgi:hypothetical protein